MTGASPLWFATRATGVIALVLLTATVLLGVVNSARLDTRRWPRLITAGLHRNVSLLVVGFLAAHILTAVLDSYAPVGWASVVVPFVSAYRPVWLGLGTVAFDLLLALVVTSLLRHRLGYRGWRATHWAAYGCWPVALWHGLGTGTDSRLPLLLAVDAVCVAAVLAAVCWRLTLSDRARASRPVVLTVATAVLVATVVFTAIGPLSPGWARRSGTPPTLLSEAGASIGPHAADREAAP